MKIYIYTIYFPTSNKYYIGQTYNIGKRMPRHLKSGSLVCKALYKYDDWTIEILHITKNKDMANLLEIEEIRHYNCIAPNGYNLTRGGEGGDTLTNNPCREEIREKNRQARKGNQNAKGFHHTEETKEKIRKAQQGRRYARGYKHTEEWKQNKSEQMKGNQFAKNHKCSEESNKRKGCKGNKNVTHRLDVKYKQLRTRIANLEAKNNGLSKYS